MHLFAQRIGVVNARPYRDVMTTILSELGKDTEIADQEIKLAGTLVKKGKGLDCSRLLGTVAAFVVKIHKKTPPPSDFKKAMAVIEDTVIHQAVDNVRNKLFLDPRRN